eukprot:1082405-Pleurochrysis_carterae.AAC.4
MFAAFSLSLLIEASALLSCCSKTSSCGQISKKRTKSGRRTTKSLLGSRARAVCDLGALPVIASSPNQGRSERGWNSAIGSSPKSAMKQLTKPSITTYMESAASPSWKRYSCAQMRRRRSYVLGRRKGAAFASA